MPKISVIIPVYNVEKYLKRCVDSVINQTLKDIEIILVDDGSPDNCPKMCDDYKELDERIVVIHKDNGGLSDARNAALDVAKGEFIGFVDSDDYIDEDMYEYLYSLVSEHNADSAMCQFYHCYPDKEIAKIEEKPLMVVDGQQAIYLIMESEKATMTVANKIYHRDMFNNVRFKYGKVSEDAFITVDLFANADKVVISNKQKYYYFHRSDSITTIKFNDKDFDAIEAYDYDYNRCVEINAELLEEVARMRCCWVRFFVLDKMALAKVMNHPRKNEVVSYLKKNKTFILKNKILTRGRKLSFLALYISFGLYCKLAVLNYQKNRGHFN